MEHSYSFFIEVFILVIIGSYSLNSIGSYIPKRRKYSYLYYDDLEYRLPMMAWVHFSIVVISYCLAVLLIVWK